MFREADAVWTDGPYMGRGSVSVPSGTLSHTIYAYGAVDIGRHTTPGELLAAAIAGSVSATIALKMSRLGAQPAFINTHARITLDQLADTWRIASVDLDVEAQVSETDVRCLDEAIQETQAHCPIASELNVDVRYKTRWIPVGAKTVA